MPPGEPSGLAFSWDVDGTTYAGETVDVTLGAGTYVVILTVTKDQRSATATATFELTAQQPAVVDVDASAYASRRVAAQGGVVLYGAVAPGGGGGLLNSSWSARTTETAWLAGANLAEGLDLDAYAETAIALASRAGAISAQLGARAGRAGRRGDLRLRAVCDFRRRPGRGVGGARGRFGADGR